MRCHHSNLMKVKGSLWKFTDRLTHQCCDQNVVPRQSSEHHWKLVQKCQFGGLTPGALNKASTIRIWRLTIHQNPQEVCSVTQGCASSQGSLHKQPGAGEVWNSDERPGPRPGNLLLRLLIDKDKFLKLTKKRDEKAIVFIYFVPPIIFSISIEMGSKMIVSDGPINSEIKGLMHLILC